MDPTTAPAVPSGTRRSEPGAPLPAVRPRATPPSGPRLMGRGDTGAKVDDLQSRLRQIAWFTGNVSDRYGPDTTAAVRGSRPSAGSP